MSTRRQSEKGKILSKSKKIKKTPRETKSQKKSLEKQKYDTYDNETKNRVIHGLLEKIRSYLKLSETPEIEEFSEFVKNKIPKKKYDQMLKEILSENIKRFKEIGKKLAPWRKKVKSWIKNYKRPETRGGLVVPVHLASAFDEKVKERIERLEVRTFHDLRRNILFPSLKEVDPDSEEADKSSFSKHWWFNYRLKHPDIDELWRDKPLKRTVDKGPDATEKWRKKNSENQQQKKIMKIPSVKKKSGDSLITEEVEVLKTNHQSPNSGQEDHVGIEEEFYQYDHQSSVERLSRQLEGSNEISESEEYVEEQEEKITIAPIESFLSFGKKDDGDDDDEKKFQGFRDYEIYQDY